ncbi:SUKH-3 domain-containing protein [Streptomyces natalensis]|uniref:SUKH-3 domain-containing protein n=1 Tax=Streptomyces natalensis TaxID=68242 RepID=UPI0004AAE60B|nr:SUKH-3 domain-containing protein [Streptomyces natalensis]
MTAGLTRKEIDQLLTDAGWHPGRDVGDRVSELAEFVVADLAAHGCQVSLFSEAEAFLRSYGFLDVSFPYDEERTDHFNTCARFCNDRAGDISELADELQRPVFPVGWDKVEAGLVVMDPAQRMFYIHHSGIYFAGVGIHEVITSLSTGKLQDAEDYYPHAE